MDSSRDVRRKEDEMGQGDLTNASPLPPTAALPSPEVTPFEAASAEQRAEIERALAELRMEDSNAVLFFGSRAQEAVTAIADEMLEGVRGKDTGPAGQALGEMVSALRAMPIEELGPKRKRSFLARLSRGARPLRRMLQQYEHVRRQVEAIGNRLDKHTSTLMRDIAVLDRLFEKTLEYFRRLEVYIAAGQEQLRRLDAEALPALEREAAAREIVAVQRAADLRARRDDLERRVHDLKLTRQVVMQSLPAIRIVQQNDKALVGKIASTMANALPLWRQQLALALTIARSAEAAGTLGKATDLTNELLTANAETLRSSTQEVRTQVERGIVDMAALKQANDSLVATIDDALRIAEEGRRRRSDAEKELAGCEAELRHAVLAARSREGGAPGRE